ncbi:MAG: hypothetical protein M1825_004455 [Sarcosagium campestre]|nr:MAG: hypothetical protein M1825_004455 [Sarcosagium campestre]
MSDVEGVFCRETHLNTQLRALWVSKRAPKYLNSNQDAENGQEEDSIKCRRLSRQELPKNPTVDPRLGLLDKELYYRRRTKCSGLLRRERDPQKSRSEQQ